MNLSTFFTLLEYAGCWRPISWSSPFKILIYSIYTLFLIFISISFVISEIVSYFTVESIDEFVAISYILVTIIVGSCKMMNMLLYRQKIISFMNMFLEEPCAASNIEEAQIQTKYDTRVRKYARRYMTMIETSINLNILNSILMNFPQGKLTYIAWFPYDYTSIIAFLWTFVFQLLVIFTHGLIHVAVDVLFFGLLMQISCQFEILLSRLNNITRDSKAVLQKYVRHHNCIYQLAKTQNDVLRLTILSQFSGSFLVLCLIMVQLLSVDLLSMEFLATVFYLTCMMMQSFLYCWYGNEVKLKSIDLSDVIFQSNWLDLNKDEKKILLISMNKTRSPIQLETTHVITVNIHFFMALLKSSYSAYNLLQNTKK